LIGGPHPVLIDIVEGSVGWDNFRERPVVFEESIYVDME
jgi:hypothetical protein